MRPRAWQLIALTALLWTTPAAAARNFPITGENELSGGFGFTAPLSDWTPGGFKWFNDYSRQLSKLTWLNFQLNVSTDGNRGCRWDPRREIYICDSWGHSSGSALELAAGVKLKWRVRKIPLQIHAKLGGALDLLFYNIGNDLDATGVAFGFRGGAGVRYFFVPTFGLGAELVHTIGPAFINHDIGAELMATLDFNFGVEWRF